MTTYTRAMDDLTRAAAALLTAPVHRTEAGGVEVVIVRMLAATHDRFAAATRAAVAAQQAERVRRLGREASAGTVRRWR